MKVKFQYADHTEWEGPPEDAHTSPDKGVIRMIVIDDGGYELVFGYKDIYYLFAVEEGWMFGADNPQRRFLIKPGVGGCEGTPIPFALPAGAVHRDGETVSQEEAVKLGLISSVDVKILHPKQRIETCEECGE